MVEVVHSGPEETTEMVKGMEQHKAIKKSLDGFGITGAHVWYLTLNEHKPGVFHSVHLNFVCTIFDLSLLITCK